jgi:hypothetical protein
MALKSTLTSEVDCANAGPETGSVASDKAEPSNMARSMKFEDCFPDIANTGRPLHVTLTPTPN